MKKIFSLIVMMIALFSTNVAAQNNNRMIVVGKDGARQAYSVSEIDSIFFAKAEGTASVNVTLGDMTSKPAAVRASIAKQGMCSYFRYRIVPKFQADQMKEDAAVVRYFNTFDSFHYTADLENEELSDFPVCSGAEYTLLTVAYDEFGVAGDVSRIDFTIPGEFVVRITDLSYINIKLDILPQDEDMSYFVRCLDEETARTLVTDEMLFQYDKDYFTKMANDYDMDIQDVLAYNTQIGEFTDFELSGYTPGRKYMIYVYGIDKKNYELATSIVRIPVQMPDVEKQDVQIDIQADVVNGYQIDACFTPVGYDGYYSFDVIEVDENMGDRAIRNLIADQWAEALAMYRSFGYEDSDILNELCTQGEWGYVFDKEANKTYVAYAYAVNDECLISSNIKYKKIRTEDVAHSDNQLTISLDKATPYSATIRITPTIEYEDYAVYAAPAKEFEGLEGDALKQYLIDQYPMTFSGEMVMDVAPMLPGVEFRVFAYGTVAGSATTDLFEFSFTSPEPVIDESMKGSMKYGEYFNSMEVSELDATYAQFSRDDLVFVPVDLMYDNDTQFYTAFFTDVDLKGKTEDDLKSWILYNADKYLTRPGTEYNILRAPYGAEITGVSFAVASDGTFSRLWKGEKLIVEKGSEGDPQYFVDNYPIPMKNAAPMGISKPASKKNYIKVVSSKKAEKTPAKKLGLSSRIKR